METNKEIDTRGLNCPLPILKAKKALAEMVSGEVLNPQAVIWRQGMTVEQYIEAAGGVTQRGNSSSVMIRRASGQVILDPREGPRPGDELIALPELGAKSFQITRDLLGLIYQTALAGYYIDRL